MSVVQVQPASTNIYRQLTLTLTLTLTLALALTLTLHTRYHTY